MNGNRKRLRYIVSLLAFIALFTALGGASTTLNDSFLHWPLSRAVSVLNDSPWARVETIARVVGGFGSGVSGEKEIYYSFYVRFLSALPIREAYTRIQLIQHGYDQLSEDDRLGYSRLIGSRVEADFERWIVVAVSFRSNDPNEESRVRQFFQSQTTGTVRNTAFLVTRQFPQVPLVAYFPPREEAVGARFVFPRKIGGVDVVTVEDKEITFELTELPAASASAGGRSRGRSRGRDRDRDENEEENKGILRTTFSVKPMVVDGELIL